MSNEPHKHHYVPKFFLKNFAVDDQQKRVTTVAKNNDMAIWSERSIDGIGHEEDFYVHLERGVPVSVETDINHRIETPISESNTWKKIASGDTAALDRSDRPILYALIRHLEVRTPHYQATIQKLAQMSADPNSSIPFTAEERSDFALIRKNPNLAKSQLNQMAATPIWAPEHFHSCLLMVCRSPVPLYTSTTPVLALSAPEHEAMWRPLPGLTPFQLVLTVNPTTFVSLALGNFGGAFTNQAVTIETALGLNRHFTGQFAKFDHVRHLVSNRQRLVEDMTWAPYDLVKESEYSVTFRRRSENS